MGSVLLLLVGFLLLVWGADRFVAGASAAAHRIGIPPLVVGLTIVAFGTSAPELAVSITAALGGANDIAVGNVLGSNIFNLLAVAGLGAAICPLLVSRDVLRRDWPLSALAALILLPLMATGGGISRLEGLLLFALFLALMAAQLRPALQQRTPAEKAGGMRTPYILFSIIAGLVCIVLGGQLSVNGATGLARAFGLSEALIGLTIVAVGTSLPELVTSLAAARRGENDIAVGNVIGSNLLNLLCILGLSATLHPIRVQPVSLIDCAFLLVITILCFLPARKGTLSRPAGAVMALGYVGYTAFLILR